jgi:hypothetical protein
LKRNAVAMENNSHIKQANPSSRKKDYLLNEYYSNPSMTENRLDEERKGRKQVPFCVEWQMYNA